MILHFTHINTDFSVIKISIEKLRKYVEKFPFKIAIVNFQLVKYRMWNVDNAGEVL